MEAPIDYRNLNLKLDVELYEKLEALAARRNTSLSALVTAELVELVADDTCYAQARKHALAVLETGFDLGTYGHKDWARDELHER